MPRLKLQLDTLDNPGDTKLISRYDGGLNTTNSNEILQDNEAIIAKNWSQDEPGAIKKVNGYTKKNTTALASQPIRGLFRVYTSAGSGDLLAICNGILFYSDDEGTTFTQATNGTGLTAANFNRGVNYNDLFFFTNKTDNVKVYTPSTNTMAASLDTPTDACEVIYKRYDRRLVVIVNATNGSTLYYSKVDPTGAAADDWSASNDAGSIAIDGAKSAALTGGVNFGSIDIIFKDEAAFQVWGYPAPQVKRIAGAPGCAAPHSVSQGSGLLFHLAHDGVWMYDGSRFIKISDPIKNIIDTISASNVRNTWGVYRKGLYWLFYSTGSTNQDCLIYDVQHSNPYAGRNVWYERDGLSINCPLVFDGAGDNMELYGGSSASDGFVYQLDSSSDGSDNTANILAIYQTKYFNMKFPSLIKRFTRIHVRYYNGKGSILINWYTNRGLRTGSFTIPVSQAGTLLGEFVLGTNILVGNTEETYTKNLPDTAVGKDISIKITHNDIQGDSGRPLVRDIEIEWEGLYMD